MKKEEQDLPVNFLSFIKKNWNWILLGVILIFGFYLRAYHIDYPVVGYHNWKETHYLTEARNFAEDGFFEHGFFIPEWDYPSLVDDPTGVHSDTFPTTSILTAIAFKIFGYKLWIARLINILFALGSVLLFYLIIKRLFEREDLALLSAAIMSINPLLVFFGRQVQLINPALFFCLLGVFYYLKWLETKSWSNTILFSVPLLLGILTKYSFALFAAPIILIFPFKKYLKKTELKKEIKDNWKYYAFIIFIIIISLLWLMHSFGISGNIGAQLSSVDTGLLLKGNFWSIIKSFAADNYTLVGVFFAFFGAILFTLFFMKNKKKLGYRFIFYYLLSSVVWFIVLAAKMKGHNYHQYPIMPLIVFLMAYCFLVIGTNINKLVKIKYANIIAFLILLLIIFFPSAEAKDRMFNTQFPGLDVAGEYIKDNKIPGERVIHSSHQAYGLLWHGDLKGTRSIPKEVEDIKFAEENLNANWLFIYNWDFKIFEEERWNYISDHYSLRQFAFVQTNQANQPVYFLLKKGGNFNLSSLNEIAKNKSVNHKDYEYTEGSQRLFYINIED